MASSPSSPPGVSPKKAGSPKRGDKSGVKVMVRIRPFNSRELAGLSADEFPTSILHFEGKKVTVLDKNSSPTDSYSFHETFWSIPDFQKQYSVSKPFADQEAVFDMTGRPAVEQALSARHCCVFAYGQTGTGKSYTMLGSPHDPGIAPRIVDHLFSELDQMGSGSGWDYNVEVSFMEIYNERVKDLLADEFGSVMSPSSAGGDHLGVQCSSPGGRRGSRRGSGAPGDGKVGSPTGRRGSTPAASCLTPSGAGSPTGRARRRSEFSSFNSRTPSSCDEYRDLKVRQSPEIGVFVEGLSRLGKEQGLHDAASIKSVMRKGMEHRATAETQMNATSSRSHAIFQICLRMANKSEGKTRYAHLNLVDLAGSERVNMSGATGQTLVEATRINLSLSTLRRVIDILVENQKRKKPEIPPFRESMLTWVLSESLGGNSETMMLATVSPAESNREDTLNTLRYAAKAKRIENTVRVNEAQGNVHLGAMQAEMQKLRQQLAQHEEGGTDDSIQRLEDKADEARVQQLEALEQLERERGELLRRQEEIQQAEEQRQRLEEEHQVLREENIEEKLVAAEDEHQRVDEELRRAVEVRLQREEEAMVKEEMARREKQHRDELEVQRRQTAERKQVQESEQQLLKRKQFALAFQKAFRKDEQRSGLDELRTRVRKAHDLTNHGEIELQTMAARVREIQLASGFLAGKVQSVESREAGMREAHGAALTGKQQQLAELTRHADELSANAGIRKSQLAEHQKEKEDRLEARRSELCVRQERANEKRVDLRTMTSKAAADRFDARSHRDSLSDATRHEVALRERLTTLTRETETLKADRDKFRKQTMDDEDLQETLREQLIDISERASQVEEECSDLNKRREALREMIQDRQSTHEEMKRFVSHRFFASGVAKQQPKEDFQLTSPPGSRTGGVIPGTFRERVWQTGGYVAADMVDRGRSQSPDPTCATRRSTTPVTGKRTVSPQQPARQPHTPNVSRRQQAPTGPHPAGSSPRRRQQHSAGVRSVRK
eukprot:TRINITY_DN3359_c2_g1_i1.p1 TRINITY_DN3359_c2_g1~~TRINITY_DN3359_c2_g1_i1.p1  ORF type:complete len:1030 (+),score=347.70 TRINITY_DN3359_c2_g1_i1:66-3092(+)